MTFTKKLNKLLQVIDADQFRTKISKEKRKIGNSLLYPIDLNEAFNKEFNKRKWAESRYNYYITLNRELMEKSVLMSAKEQKEFLIANGEKEPIYSYNQMDFVKDKIAVEVQFGKYAFVAFDLFVKHMLFYSGGVINLGIEILPTKKMQSQMSSGVAYYEGEVYNVMRQGRNSPPVPLLILGRTITDRQEAQLVTAVWRNGGCSAAYESLEVGSSAVLRLNFCAKNPATMPSPKPLPVIVKDDPQTKYDRE